MEYYSSGSSGLPPGACLGFSIACFTPPAPPNNRKVEKIHDSRVFLGYDLKYHQPLWTTQVCWVQEEPKNMGAWTFVRPCIITATRKLNDAEKQPRYIGRTTAAAPATGLSKVRKPELMRLSRFYGVLVLCKCASSLYICCRVFFFFF